MHPMFPHQLSITWEVAVLEVSPDGLVAPSCLKCHASLDIHQPEEDRPSQLLGTCGECGAWHMIEVSPDGTEAYLFNMPGVEFVRDKLAEARKPGGPKRRAPRNPRRLVQLSASGPLI